MLNGALLCLSGQLPVEYMRGKPLCMELYPLLFSSCRIPGPKHDYVTHHRRSPTHITVVRNYQVMGEVVLLFLSFLVISNISRSHMAVVTL